MFFKKDFFYKCDLNIYKHLLTTLIILLISSYSFNAQSSNIFDLEDEDYEYNEPQIYDPFEKYNRRVYDFNIKLDKYTLKPVAKAYQKAIPATSRKLIRNFIYNINRPLSAVSSLLQLKFNNALTNIGYFVLDSSIGFLGFYDISASLNEKENLEDFAQTIAHYTNKTGPYLMLPIFGPSNVADLSGSIADTFANPLYQNDNDSLYGFRIATKSLDIIDIRERLLDVLDDINKNSLDPYIATRNLYYQRRDSKID